VELLHELVPTATVIALLVNPTIPALAEPIIRASQAAAPAWGQFGHVTSFLSGRRPHDAA
jgi:hypothetical protein